MAHATDDEKHAAVRRAHEVGQAAAAREFGRNASTLSKWTDAGYGDEGEAMGTEAPMFDTPDGPPDSKPSGKGSGKGSSKGSGKGSKPAGRTPGKAQIEGLLATIGIGVSMVNAYDGQRIMEGSADLAEKLHDLAKENPAIRRALNAALATSAWGAVASALAPIILPIAANHGLVAPELAVMVDAPVPPGKAGKTSGANGSGKVSSLFGPAAPDYPPNTGQQPGGTWNNDPANEPGGGPASGSTASTPDDPEDDGT